MTYSIDRSRGRSCEGSSGGSGPASPQRLLGRLARSRRALAFLTALALAVAVVSALALPSSSSASQSAHGVTTMTIVSPSYKPQAAVGTTDDYHCTLINPHLTRDSYVVSSEFRPGSLEVHHAALSVVPPSLAPTALQDNSATGGKGWTCFGAPSLPNASFAALLSTPFLSTWGPGHGADALPRGSGIWFPAGSLVIAQVHYNLLVGDRPVRNSLELSTVPASTPLAPLRLQEVVAPPDLPCPTGVTGPLCDRSASLADQARRFGQDQAVIVNGIEGMCGHDPSNPPAGDTTSCTQRVRQAGYIVRAQPHMHLLGQGFSMVLDPGTPEARTVISVPNYNFHEQKAYNLSTPIPVKPGDRLQITCTYDPSLAQELPILRKAPPHFVTWGDGSSDEMCVGLAWTSTTVPDDHSSV